MKTAEIVYEDSRHSVFGTWALKVQNSALRPFSMGDGQLEHRSESVPTIYCGAIQMARLVEDQTGVRIVSALILEAIYHGLVPHATELRHFEYSAPKAAVGSCSV